jgi:hypothetical protein
LGERVFNDLHYPNRNSVPIGGFGIDHKRLTYRFQGRCSHDIAPAGNR